MVVASGNVSLVQSSLVRSQRMILVRSRYINTIMRLGMRIDHGLRMMDNLNLHHFVYAHGFFKKAFLVQERYGMVKICFCGIAKASKPMRLHYSASSEAIV
jgi:hypothetical protein